VGEAWYLIYQHSKSIDVTGERRSEIAFSGSEYLWSCPVEGNLGHGENVEHDGV
jgi:hypothetical protein